MRIWLFAALTLLGSTSSLAAQELARAEITASIHVPEFMSIERASAHEYTRADGMRVRRVTLLVSANRTWRLEVSAQRGDVEYTVSKASGRAAQREEVVVEFLWKHTESAPRLDEVAYSLVAR
jgi:hypothetical protein